MREVLLLPSPSTSFNSDPPAFFHIQTFTVLFDLREWRNPTMVFLRRETMRVRCACCRSWFVPDPRVKNQRFCSKKECQRARKTLWQRQKLANDSDYQADKLDCQRAWRNGNPSYWKNWRAGHPEYVERNRKLQEERRGRGKNSVAKMDATGPLSSIKTGDYYIVPDLSDCVAKMDASARKVRLILMA